MIWKGNLLYDTNRESALWKASRIRIWLEPSADQGSGFNICLHMRIHVSVYSKGYVDFITTTVILCLTHLKTSLFSFFAYFFGKLLKDKNLNKLRPLPNSSFWVLGYRILSCGILTNDPFKNGFFFFVWQKVLWEQKSTADNKIL